MTYEHRIAKELHITTHQARSAIRLLDEGNTIPFIARYRKEMTLNLDELQLRRIAEKVDYFQTVDSRRDTIVESIRNQNAMSDELYHKLQDAETLVELEDLYLPYKPRRVTRAMKAHEAGLEPLAQQIIRQPKRDMRQEAGRYVCDQYATIDDVLAGARDIIAQMIADDSDIRGEVRRKASEWGVIHSKQIKSSDDPKRIYKVYYEFEARVKWIKPHQVLALNRGETEKVLRIKLEIAERDWYGAVQKKFRVYRQSEWGEQLELAIQDSAKRLLLPAIERDIRRNLTESAHEHAIGVFSENVRRLLLQPPLNNQIVLGIDPGFRTGCKIAIVDVTGKVLETATIYPHPPQSKYDDSIKLLGQLVERFGVTVIVIGNGTASRETEQLVADLVRIHSNLKYLIVSEAGASVYSASELARDELPSLDVTLRGAVSIARRVQDPLAELVKIDPKSIGVGMYQHDVDQTQLAESLIWVVQSVVNHVGVDLNTSSVALLKHIAGMTERNAIELIQYRNQHGQFHDRAEILQVKGIGARTFEQSAGFLRIRNGDNWLDRSAIHPESYDVALEIFRLAGIEDHSTHDIRQAQVDKLIGRLSLDGLAKELGVGSLTIEDIVEQIKRPGRDPREDIPLPILRKDVLKMSDLKVDMILQGTVRNMVDFGAFVDIGVKQDGLLHSSKIPNSVDLQLGDVITVRIISLDMERGRIGFALGKS